MRVVIGEDEALLREGLNLVLTRGGFEVVAAPPTRWSWSARPDGCVPISW